MMTIPTLKTLRILGAAIVTLVAATASAGDVSGTVKLNGATSEVVVVYIEKIDGAAPPTSPGTHTMKQKNTQFAPFAAVVMQGDQIAFPNEDKFYHNVFSVSANNKFDLGLYRGGVAKSVTMKGPGEVEIFCNIHPGMAAKVLVLQNPHYARLEPDGKFTIKGVPAGNHTLVAWTPAHIAAKSAITVPASGAVTAAFSLEARNEAAHLNKQGQPYGRYK